MVSSDNIILVEQIATSQMCETRKSKQSKMKIAPTRKYNELNISISSNNRTNQATKSKWRTRSVWVVVVVLAGFFLFSLIFWFFFPETVKKEKEKRNNAENGFLVTDKCGKKLSIEHHIVYRGHKNKIIAIFSYFFLVFFLWMSILITFFHIFCSVYNVDSIRWDD